MMFWNLRALIIKTTLLDHVLRCITDGFRISDNPDIIGQVTSPSGLGAGGEHLRSQGPAEMDRWTEDFEHKSTDI